MNNESIMLSVLINYFLLLSRMLVKFTDRPQVTAEFEK